MDKKRFCSKFGAVDLKIGPFLSILSTFRVIWHRLALEACSMQKVKGSDLLDVISDGVGPVLATLKVTNANRVRG